MRLIKSSLYFLILIVALSACKKDKTRHFTIVASKPDSIEAVLKIDNTTYSFSEVEIIKEIFIGEDDVISASLSVNNNYSPLNIELREDANFLGRANGTGYIYMIITNEGMSSASSNQSSGGNGSGSGCNAVQCSATTQANSRCKRTTTNCSGRCWQHE